jgi:hypothetical protein
MMGPICPHCDHPTHDVSDFHLRSLRETHRGSRADAVYFCVYRCKIAYLLIEGAFAPIDRRWVEGLEG